MFSEGPAVCHNLIFDLKLWTTYADTSPILDRLFSRPSFRDITCFPILAGGPHLDATLTSRNIFRSSSIANIFNCGPQKGVLLLF